MADSVADKARKARQRARTQNSNRGSTGSTDRLVMDLTRGKESLLDKIGGRYVNEAEQRAANIMQQRRAIDTGKTAARATAIEKREVKKKAAKTLMTGVSGGAKKAAPKPATKKAAAKPKTIGTGPNKAKVTPMSQEGRSE
jgi:6-phosphogluconate dehydrogenase